MDNVKRNALGLIFQSIAENEAGEVKQAERASRLVELTQSDCWKLDLVPILQELYDDYVQAIKIGEMSPDTLKVFDDLINKIDGSVQIGAGALRRLAQRRLQGTEQKAKIQEANKASSGPIF